jgi:putrescine aminotransferase
MLSEGHLNYLEEIGHDFIIDKRKGSHIYDSDGMKYLDGDCSASIYNLGRREEEIVREFKKAMVETDQGNFPIISEEKALLAKALADFTPGNLEYSYFSVIRGESFEFICKLVRGYTNRSELISFDGSWFGQTGFALSLSDRSDKENFAPLIPDVRIIPANNMEAAKQAITKKTAAVFIEPVQVENGCRVINKSFLQYLREQCNKTGAVLIFDETQTGLGRTGKRFALEHVNVMPDVLNIGESLGAGLFPIAATVYTRKINKFMRKHPLIHLSTFGGSDLGCRVAMKSLEIYEDKKPWENAYKIGTLLMESLNRLNKDHSDMVKGVSGIGLAQAIDFGTIDKAKLFCKIAAKQGLFVCPAAIAKTFVVLRPPLTIDEYEMVEMVDIMIKTIKEMK